MSWLDALKQQVLDSLSSATAGTNAPAEGAPREDAPASDPSGMFDGVVALLRDKGLGSLMAAFEQQGLRDVFASWVSKGSNLPISPDQIQKILDPGALEALAQKFGFSTAQTSALLAQLMPRLVDQMTPEGRFDDAPASEASPEPDATESGRF